MGIEVINKLQEEVKSLKQELESQKTAEEKKLEELKKELGQLAEERKTSFADESVSKDELSKAKKVGTDLHLKSILTGRDIASFEEYKQVASVN